MPDFIAMLQKKQAAQTAAAPAAQPTTEKAATLPPSFEEHKFKSKDKKDKDEKAEGAMHEKEESHEEKKAAQQALGVFADTVSRLTEKTAVFVREDHGTAAEQLYRNMISSSMNLKLAGVTHPAFEEPDQLIKNAYELMCHAADTLDIPLA